MWQFSILRDRFEVLPGGSTLLIMENLRRLHVEFEKVLLNGEIMEGYCSMEKLWKGIAQYKKLILPGNDLRIADLVNAIGIRIRGSASIPSSEKYRGYR